MKKLIAICMLAAIGAVGLIEKSEAAPNCNLPGGCGGMPHFGADHHWNGNNSGGIHIQHGGGINIQPMHQHSNNNGNYEWWKHRGHHHNWYGGGPSIGFGIYSSPGYYYSDPYYYDDPYAYDVPSYRYDEPSYRYREPVANRCNAWAGRLRGLGYRNVRATDCAGSSYVYRATKAGKAVKVTVRASSGTVIRVAKAY